MKQNNRGANTNSIQMLIDIVVLLIAYLFSRLYVGNAFVDNAMMQCFSIVLVFMIIFIASNKEARIYDVTLFFYFDRFFKIVAKSWITAAIGTTFIIFFFEPTYVVRHFFYAYLVSSFVLQFINVIISRILQIMTQNQNAPRAAFVGVFEDYEKFNYFLNKTSMRLEEVGYINLPGRSSKGVYNVLGEIKDIEKIIRQNELDQIFFFRYSSEPADYIQKYVDICMEMGVTVRVVLDSPMLHRSNSFVSSIGVYPMITYHTIALNQYEQMVKRFIDIVGSIVGIVLTSPVMLITALAIKLDSKGPVFFVQKRVGQNGRVFKMLKFRSMCVDAEAKKEELMKNNEMEGGVMFKMKNDPRVTKVGRFIRKTSIDELPQFFNILVGHMSLVGTRPPTLDEVSKYGRSQWRRISIKPGLTGLWQVSGRSDITDFDEVVNLDLEYIDRWSLTLDAKILLGTVGLILGRKGAY